MSTEAAAPIEANDSVSVERRGRRRLLAEKGFYVHRLKQLALASLADDTGRLVA